MTQSFRTHRLFQLLSWIDALSRGYDAPGNRSRPAETSIKDERHRTPTVSNLAYYLLTDAEYNKAALEDQFSWHAVRWTPDKEVFTYVKQDITRHLTQYPGDLFTTETVEKTADDHPTFDADLESRRVEAKAYYLTNRGQERLAELAEAIQIKRDLITKKKTIGKEPDNRRIMEGGNYVLTDDAIDRIAGDIDHKTINMDSITVPYEKMRWWETETYRLPHVAVIDAARDRAPTVYRD